MILVVICVVVFFVGLFCYNDNNKRKAKANANAMKKMLKELEQEKANEENSKNNSLS